MSITAAIEPDAIDEGDDFPVRWTQLPPGPELAAHLATAQWSAFSDRELVDAMDAARRQTTWAQAHMLEAVAELTGRRKADDPVPSSERHRRICGEVSLELMVTGGQAEELVVMADVLPTLKHTWAALRTGDIDYGRARVMADGLSCVDDDLARRLDADLIGHAINGTQTMLRARLSRALKRADPEAYAKRTKRSRSERRVEIFDNEDDTCDLIGRHLGAADAHAIYNRLTAAAHAMQADGDTRPIDHIRLDLCRDLLRGIPLPEATHHLVTTPPHGSGIEATGQDETAHGAESTTAPRPSGRAAEAGHADVAAPGERQIAHALAEAADEHLTRVFNRARAEGRLDGLARVIGEAVEAMNAALDDVVDSWCQATGDMTGQHHHRLDRRDHHGHPGYRPPAALQRLIQRRHSTCVFPTCNRKAVHCDLDHTTPYDKGGRTCKCNLAPLCRTHHRLFKQHRQWKLIQLWPGLLIWVAPAGTWHIVLPQ